MDGLHARITRRGWYDPARGGGWLVLSAAPCDGGLQLAPLAPGEDQGDVARRYGAALLAGPLPRLEALALLRREEGRP